MNGNPGDPKIPEFRDKSRKVGPLNQSNFAKIVKTPQNFSRWLKLHVNRLEIY